MYKNKIVAITMQIQQLILIILKKWKILENYFLKI